MPTGVYKRTRKHSLAMKKRFCKRGHDTWICGRSNRGCNECKKERRRKKKNKLKQKKYYIANREKIILRMKEYWKEHREELLLKKRKYYEDNKKEITRKMKKFVQKHRKELNLKIIEKKKKNIIFRLRRRLRERFNNIIRRNTKAGSAVRDLGCSVEFFKKYIEKKFKKGMTWKNWGIFWELDHIKELWEFDLTDRKQFLEAVNYNNLQPLTIPEHKKKTAKKNLERIRKSNGKEYIFL